MSGLELLVTAHWPTSATKSPSRHVLSSILEKTLVNYSRGRTPKCKEANVVYARWSPCTLRPCYQISSQWTILWAMDWTRWPSVLATQITRPHSIRFLSMGPFKDCRLCNTSEWCRGLMGTSSKCLPGDTWWQPGVWANSPVVCTSCSDMCANWRTHWASFINIKRQCHTTFK
jgi:hypothetical protein